MDFIKNILKSNLKNQVKKKLMKILAPILTPILLVVIIAAIIIGSAAAIGEWFSSKFGEGAIEDIGWVQNVSDEVLENSNMTRKQFELMVQAEVESYYSQDKTLQIQKEEDIYRLELDENGNIVQGEYGHPNIVFDYTRTYYENHHYDLSDSTAEYRLPWQLVYAVSLISSLSSNDNTDDIDITDIGEELNNSDFSVSNRTIKKAIKLLDTVYYPLKEYIKNSKTIYYQSELERAPHTGNMKKYVPEMVFTKIETCFYDYEFINNTINGDSYYYVNTGVNQTPRTDRFVSCLTALGCSVDDISIIVEILIQLGGCDDLVTDMVNLFSIESTSTIPHVVEVDLGDEILTEVTSFALLYVGRPYKYGGTNLLQGIDCSAYVQAIYSRFGVNLPRTSRQQVKVGIPISGIRNAMPGDLIFYAKDGFVNHVALYLGGNKIVHASNSNPYPRGGIKVTENAQYKPIYAIRRVR